MKTIAEMLSEIDRTSSEILALIELIKAMEERRMDDVIRIVNSDAIGEEFRKEFYEKLREPKPA